MGLEVLTNLAPAGEVAVSVADTVTGVDHGSLEQIFNHLPGAAKHEPSGTISSFPWLAIETADG